jgi:excisionase family DNA binding protein
MRDPRHPSPISITDDPRDELPTREAAIALGRNVRTIRRAIERGELAATRTGSSYRIAVDDLMRYAARSDARASPRSPARLVAFPTLPTVSSVLPQPLSSFIGRAADVAAVVALVTDPTVRLLTLTGPGGIGKTRLALAATDAAQDRFPDGVAFVALAALSNPAHVLPAICQALGLREVAGRDRRSQLLAFLRTKRLLLVIDNVEHVLAAAPEIADIAAGAPQVTLLATSRAPLRVAGEQEIAVAPLSLPPSALPATAADLLASDATRLFIERAQAHDPSFRVDAEMAPLIAEICARLDGLPLAIELAAARVKVLPPRHLRDRLERRLPLLTGGVRDGPHRHRTMRDAIAWSFDLLNDAEQALFRHLAVFSGGCTLAAAEWVSGERRGGEEARSRVDPSPITHHLSPSSSDTLDILAALIDHGLVMRGIGPEGEPRFRMLETIREYGLERTEASEAEATRAAHARYFLDMARELRPLVTTEATLAPLDRLAADDANLRAALAWLDDHGPAGDFVALVASLCCYWIALSLLPEAQSSLVRALAKRHEATPQDRTQLMIGYAEMLMLRGEDGKAEEAFAEGLSILREAGSPFDLAIAVLTYGAFLNYGGQYVAAEAHLDEALSLAEAIDDEVLRAAVAGGALANLSDSARGQGDLELAATRGEEALRRHAGRHLELAETRTLMDLAGIAKDQGDHRLVVARCLACLERMGERGDMRLVADALSGIATAATVWGHYRTGLLLFAAADALRERVGLAMSLPSDLAATERSFATLRGALRDEDFAAAWAEGRAIPLARAVATAATVTPPTNTPPVAQPPVKSPLTRREQDVLRLLAAGQTDRQIAETLFIGLRTVSWHVSTILGKLEARTRREAVERARAAGFI